MLFCGLPLPESVETVRLSVVHVVPLVPDPNASGAAVLIRPTSSRRRSMKGMSGAFPGRVRAPNGRRRTSWPSGQAGLGSGLRAFKGRIVRVNSRSPAASQLPNPGDDVLEEVQKSLKRLKILEGLKADGGPFVTLITTPDDDPPEPSAPEKEDYGSHVARPSKVFATLLVTLVVASSVGWVLSHPGTVPRNAFDVLGPRWKDESATHFTFAASADFGGLDNTDSMALAVRGRTAVS